MVRLLAIAIGCLATLSTTAQNLVPNPGFEKVNNCPKFWSEKPSDLTATHWESPTEATPDNFKACSNVSGVPNNWAGIMHAHTGDAYGGFIARRNYNLDTDDPKRSTHREYLQTKLTQPLVAGRKYEVGLWISLAENCRMASDQIQIAFTTEKIGHAGRHIVKATPQFSTPAGAVIKQTGEWVRVTGTFVANGGEIYATIGNFSSNKGKTFEHVYNKIRNEGKAFDFSYYFVDDFSIRPLDVIKNEEEERPRGGISGTTELKWDYERFQRHAIANNGGEDAGPDPDKPKLIKNPPKDRIRQPADGKIAVMEGHTIVDERPVTNTGNNATNSNGNTNGSNSGNATVGSNADTRVASAGTNASEAKTDPNDGVAHFVGDGHDHSEDEFATSERKDDFATAGVEIEEYDPNKHKGPIVKDFECECNVCNSIRHRDGLFPMIAIDDLDSATFRIGQIIDLNPIAFDVRSTRIPSHSEEELLKLAFLLREMPQMEVELVIHMDVFNEDLENKDLSKATAESIYNYLRKKGVDNKILYNGYGRALTPPLDGRQRDRTIELIIRKI